MTKSELLAAIAAAPDTTKVYVDINDTSIWRSVQSVDYEDGDGICLDIVVEPSDEEDDDDSFSAEDYAHIATLLRQHMNTDQNQFQAVCSNNLSIILGALDRLSPSEPVA